MEVPLRHIHHLPCHWNSIRTSSMDHEVRRSGRISWAECTRNRRSIVMDVKSSIKRTYLSRTLDGSRISFTCRFWNGILSGSRIFLKARESEQCFPVLRACNWSPQLDFLPIPFIFLFRRLGEASKNDRRLKCIY